MPSEPSASLSRRRALEIDPENRGLTWGQIEIFAMAMFHNAPPTERPGRWVGNDSWKFWGWEDLSDEGKVPWRKKALHVYATLTAYGNRLVNLDA